MTQLEAAEFEIACLKQTIRRFDDSSKGKDWQRRERLEAVAETARSVLSEEGVREYLSAYVMGIELIERLDALEKI